jgi:hypothetical protein
MQHCNLSVQGAVEASRDKVTNATQEKDEVKSAIIELRSVLSKCYFCHYMQNGRRCERLWAAGACCLTIVFESAAYLLDCRVDFLAKAAATEANMR